MKRFIVILFGVAALIGLGLVVVDRVFGRMATVALVRHGGAVFVPVAKDSSQLSPSMRLALSGQVPAVVAGPLDWRDVGDGLEVAELPVLAGTREVDRLEDGRPLGPADYDAKQGALVASPATTVIRELAHVTWQAAFAGARDALVSYPLLLGPDGKARPIKPSSWLANRSFVGLDKGGRIVSAPRRMRSSRSPASPPFSRRRRSTFARRSTSTADRSPARRFASPPSAVNFAATGS